MIVCYSICKIYTVVLVMIAHATIWEFVRILLELKSVAMCLTTHSIFLRLICSSQLKLSLPSCLSFL